MGFDALAYATFGVVSAPASGGAATPSTMVLMDLSPVLGTGLADTTITGASAWIVDEQGADLLSMVAFGEASGQPDLWTGEYDAATLIDAGDPWIERYKAASTAASGVLVGSRRRWPQEFVAASTGGLTADDVQDALTSQGFTSTRAAKLDDLDAPIMSRQASGAPLDLTPVTDAIDALHDFDPAADPVAHVTLVDTTTDLTNAPPTGAALQDILDGVTADHGAGPYGAAPEGWTTITEATLDDEDVALGVCEDQDGNPLGDVLITARVEGSSDTPYNTRSRGNGTYSLDVPPGATYTVRFVDPDQETQERTVTVDA